ncbi:hypothetical protein [Shouchella hunanensis]|uniref:VWFA domain-containing protein n=1 Tax=Shouchella hunanensis TaxID=766894 RepID=A0ABY7W5L2_9BACI|nr:hypothetical protein [Shouchella hunanensis]WDF02010.1 hypothetical protein PQ477_10780 [Shouchella hunanensis]
MATIYRSYRRPDPVRPGQTNTISTAITYGVSSHNNIPVSVYDCKYCYATCASVNIRLQRMVTSAVYETVGLRLNRRVCVAQFSTRVDETFTNVRKSSAPMRVLWTIDGTNETSPIFYHA